MIRLRFRGLWVFLSFLTLSAGWCLSTRASGDEPTRGHAKLPNIVLIITDDQGYGDLSCHGNTQLKTPALDALYRQSVRLTNFHVDPTCSPTRSALMTGRYSSRTGVWHTIRGRSFLRKDEVTLPKVLSAAGYRTGIFGKWHLGDNYPLRAQDRGFQETLVHGGGGVGQTPDAWGNDYFDDRYFHNGKLEQQSGYCTDVFFRAATEFISRPSRQPFFAYIATNAPHSPYTVADDYSKLYRDQGIPSPRAEFYGMIANIDENVGRLMRRLDELALSEDTIVIWMTDNGSAAGVDNSGGFNAGMRAMKGSEYDGGHRVPCFLRCPSRWKGNRDLPALTAHIDLFPTLLELCGVATPEGVRLDGRSLAPLLADPMGVAPPTRPARTLFVHSQRVEQPEKWRQSAVLTDRWRLINGKELYDIRQDPGQMRDLAAKTPEIVAELRRAYDDWWADIFPRFGEYVRIELGSAQANPATLTCHDWHSDQVPFDHLSVKKDPAANGFWAVEFVRGGTYQVTLRARPQGIAHQFKAGNARLKIGELERSQPVSEGTDAVVFKLPVAAGPTLLQTWIDDTGGPSRGAFFVDVERIGD
ncbi:MAG: N-acetylgalactosamine 6-sulfate sulfatase [Planctomycetaceae bacterium]|nr:N-acetylgalactosamine 6-sulfate sulfatase [Planctomycetaceae bacterium]